MAVFCGIDWAEDVRHEVACGEWASGWRADVMSVA
jgi:hypothetical protein